MSSFTAVIKTSKSKWHVASRKTIHIENNLCAYLHLWGTFVRGVGCQQTNPTNKKWQTGVDWFIWWRRSDRSEELTLSQLSGCFISHTEDGVSELQNTQPEWLAILFYITKKMKLEVPLWRKSPLGLAKTVKICVGASVLPVKQTKRCVHCCAAWFQLAASSLDSPGLLIFFCLGEELGAGSGTGKEGKLWPRPALHF